VKHLTWADIVEEALRWPPRDAPVIEELPKGDPAAAVRALKSEEES
jgi:hypothetical protein